MQSIQSTYYLFTNFAGIYFLSTYCNNESSPIHPKRIGSERFVKPDFEPFLY